MVLFLVIIISAALKLVTSADLSLNKLLKEQLPSSLQDEVDLQVPDIVEKYNNYSCEIHEVITLDGYILTLHRLLAKNIKTNKKGSVLLMHGILASSSDWIITGPQNGLGYILADEGYDVWLGNARGNRYSRRHISLDVESKRFWDFSWHEIGYYDIPAMIDYITAATNESAIFHIGHSQGTTTFYVMCALKPEYNSKIQAHISLAPVAFTNHMTSPFMQILAKTTFLISPIFQLIGVNEFLPKNGAVNKIGAKICGFNAITGALCTNTLFAICGFNYKQLNTTILPLILAHVPAGSSTKQLVHYSQGINSGEFRQFDYGFFENFKRYKSCSPPNYNLAKITAPIYLFYSKNDWISSYWDVKKLVKKLHNVQGKYLMARIRFNHLDYLFGIDAPKILYPKIINILARY